MKKISFLVILIVIALTANAQIELRLNLQKGKTYIQTADVKMNMKMEMQGIKMDMDMPVSMTISMKVVDIQNDNFVFECTYDAIKMKAKIMGKSFSFDSSDKNPDRANPFQIFSSFIGKSFTMILDNRQNILDIKGLDKLFASILDNDIYTETQKAEMNQMLQGFFGEEKIKENYSSSNMIFPQEPVNVGFTWKTETSQNVQGMNMQVKNAYKVEKITAKTVEISQVSQYNMDMSMNDNAQMKITMDNAQAIGTYIIDLQTGWTKSVKSNTDMKMLIISTQEGKEISTPMQITMEMTVK